MDLLKNLLTRLSDSLFASVPKSLKGRGATRSAPTLRLVSHNPNPNPSSTAESVRRRFPPPSAAQAESLEQAIRNSVGWLLARQHPEQGCWVAELEADTTLTSEYLMLRHFMGVVDVERERKAVRYLEQTQLPDGGW
ncbi:MAG: squalene--hopene cyclase, partial [bacterium]